MYLGNVSTFFALFMRSGQQVAKLIFSLAIGKDASRINVISNYIFRISRQWSM